MSYDDNWQDVMRDIAQDTIETTQDAREGYQERSGDQRERILAFFRANLGMPFCRSCKDGVGLESRWVCTAPRPVSPN